MPYYYKYCWKICSTSLYATVKEFYLFYYLLFGIFFYFASLDYFKFADDAIFD